MRDEEKVHGGRLAWFKHLPYSVPCPLNFRLCASRTRRSHGCVCVGVVLKH